MTYSEKTMRHMHTQIINDNGTTTQKIKHPKRGILGFILAIIPGSILWLILAYYTALAGLDACLITISGFVGFRKLGGYMSKNVKNIILFTIFILIFFLTSVITTYTLYTQYNKDVIKQTTIDELRESFLTALKNNGQTEEQNNDLLKNKYHINGFEDTEGLNRFVKETIAKSYKESHKVSTVPDTIPNAIVCMFQSLAYNRTIAKPFLLNIISGIVISILTSSFLLKMKYFEYYPSI